MDYYQGVVYDYLQQCDAAMFIKAECPIQLERAKMPPKGTSWICDAMAINIREHTVYLCEVSYSKTLHALVRRLEAWSREWPKLCNAIVRDYLLSESEPVPWRFQPWVFVPETLRPTLTQRLAALASSSSSAGTDVMPAPKVYSFEEVGPWNFTPYNLTPRFTKPDA